MDIASFAIEFVKYALAGSLVVGLANWMFWSKYNAHVFKMKLLESRREANKQLLPLRLQAYERLVLFVERLDPNNLLLRLHIPGLSAVDFQEALLAEIRAEFQHNVTQQLYVSDVAWSVVRRLKEDTIALIRNGGSGLSATATANELIKILLAHIAEQEENPYHLALKAIKSELGS